MALTLLLLAAPAYGYSSIIAHHTETHLEAFARRERATISFYPSPRAAPLPSTSNVTENRELAVVINDSLQGLYYPVSSMTISRICTKSNL